MLRLLTEHFAVAETGRIVQERQGAMVFDFHRLLQPSRGAPREPGRTAPPRQTRRGGNV